MARADVLHRAVIDGLWRPGEIRTALYATSPRARDAWVDRLLGIVGVMDDGDGLPRGCAPYLPCSVDAVLRAIEAAEIGETDLFVDIGSGIGRAGLLVHLLTGASVLGVEIQHQLVAAAREHATRLRLPACTVVQGDAAHLTGSITRGTVFFLYCPFGGRRLDTVVDALAPIAQTRSIRICCVDLALPSRPWLSLQGCASGDLRFYRSRSHTK